MEYHSNEYQIYKTIRFGLSPKNKKSIDGRAVYKSHQEFADLVEKSIERIKQEKESSANKNNRALPLDEIRKCLGEMADFLTGWANICENKHQIALDKDYYKTLSKRLGFEGFWVDLKGRKQPQAREILLVALDNNDNKKKSRNEYIIDYWNNLLLNANRIYAEANEKLTQYEEAERLNMPNNKPNEVELKKTFLALASIVSEVLKPIYNSQIIFPNIAKINGQTDNGKKFIDFVMKYKSASGLITDIENIKQYFEENGANITYCKASLNPKSVIRSSQNEKTDKDPIKELGIENILGKYNDATAFWREMEKMSPSAKSAALNDRNKPLFLRSLLFKYKPIPSILHSEIARQLAPKCNKSEEQIKIFLQEIGIPKSPQKDYADDKDNFNIEKYPLKVAFDFAWEGCARYLYHKDSDFPNDQCKTFLQKVFEVNLNDVNVFGLYAKLLELNARLATYSNYEKNDGKKIEFGKSVEDIIGELEKIVNDNKVSHLLKIKKMFKIPKANYDDAKKQLGMYRGRLKENITKYKNITEANKKIAMVVGRNFATARDIIMDKEGANRLTHYAAIVEDKNADRYLLLQDISSGENIYDKELNGYRTYYLNAVTARSISLDAKKLHDKEANNPKWKYLSAEEKKERSEKLWKKVAKEKFPDIKNIDNKTTEQIKKEIDAKGQSLVYGCVSREKLNMLVEKGKCLLLPIINQDIAKEVKSDSNQFTKDWNAIFDRTSNWNFLPEVKVTYRKPTPNYPDDRTGDKRYSRFQINAHFLCNYIPTSNGSYVSMREQIEKFRDDNEQKNAVKKFNDKINTGRSDKFYVFGIDRGQNELATLCVIDNDKKIQGPFKIYTRKFNSEKKQWEHTFLADRYILDLSNLKVETTISIDGNPDVRQVLVDQSEVLVKDKETQQYTRPNLNQIRMQHLAYIRKMQFKMQNNPEFVLNWYTENNTKEKIEENFVSGLVSFYYETKEPVKLKDPTMIPVKDIIEMLNKFSDLMHRKNAGEDVKSEMDALIELDPAENLKKGIVANMIGVIAFLLREYNYNVYISLEDLSKAHGPILNGITGIVEKTNKNCGRQADVDKYAGLGLYNFFETQLLRKLFRIQQDSGNIIHLVPPFRAQKNYDNIVPGKEKVKNQFGIVFFVDANSTSKMCPVCGTTNDKPNLKKNPNAMKGIVNGKEMWLLRDKNNGDRIHCYVCGFDTDENHEENPLKYIKSGDDNAAYLISTSAIKAYELATTFVNNKK